MNFKKVRTVEDLEELGIGNVEYNISYRGGSISFDADDVANYFDISVHELPGKVGAYCNYLGGGIRGSICTSPVYKVEDDNKREKIAELAEACKRVYNNIENDGRLNDTEYPDGDVNWDAVATKNVRNAGITSAY